VAPTDRVLDEHRLDFAAIDRRDQLARVESLTGRQPLDGHESVAGGGVSAPARQPGRLELQTQLMVFDIAAAREDEGMGSHVDRALGIGRTAQGSNSTARPSEVAGDDRQVDACFRDFGRIAVAVIDTGVTDYSGAADVGSGLVNQRSRVPALRLGGTFAHATRGVNDRRFPDVGRRHAGRRGDAVQSRVG
jgi:hypothetical protein